MKKELRIITDLQYGSCGKGLFAGFLAKAVKPDTLITAWAPNAGHTFVDADGFKMVHIMLPNGVIASSVKRILIGPGSVIDPDRMQGEIDWLTGLGLLAGKELLIHENAAIVDPRHQVEERNHMYKIGSTMKGVGAAVIDKIRRNPENPNVAYMMEGPLRRFVVDADVYNAAVDEAQSVILEGAQGFSLSINQGFYPYTTSRDCTTHQLLSDCGIPFGMFSTHVVGVCRTYPIRVANRVGSDGKQIGWSGPCYTDQEETNWMTIGQEPELTTVTKLPRRVFTFSNMQIAEAIRMNGVGSVFLNFCNYCTEEEVWDLIQRIEVAGAPVRWTGYGPRETDVKEWKGMEELI